MNNLQHIEFFAGCGGMALGMDAAGFQLRMANEVSPMAAETFALNIIGQNLLENTERVFWIHSDFPKSKMNARLRENLLDEKVFRFNDVPSVLPEGKTLLIGDINKLKETLETNAAIRESLSGVDLISGGPPCQSFSLAGKREKNNYKNRLPLTFAETCGLLQPKAVLLENVKGILAPFTEQNEKYYAWIEVAKAFSLQGFVPLCMLVNSKFFGVPQNRPRFLMMAFREDVFRAIHSQIGNNQSVNSLNFFNEVQSNRGNLRGLILQEELCCYNLEKEDELHHFDGVWLPKPILHQNQGWVSVKDAIGDLRVSEDGLCKSVDGADYVRLLNTLFEDEKPTSATYLKNHELRKHSVQVRSRFRFFQLLNRLVTTKKSVLDFIRSESLTTGIEEEIVEEFDNVRLEKVLFPDGSISILNEPSDWVKYLSEISLSKKHSQKALVSNQPAPAQLTIPDDLCHFESAQPRVLTVRETARIQSFPDWYEFKSKVTTGGKNRRFEVPQYTQVGNAVPPLLAYRIGKHLRQLLESIE